MASSAEKAIQKEIEKAVDWYRSHYQNPIEVYQRYDKETLHFSWRIVIQYRQEDWVLPLGISVKMMESPIFFPQIIKKLKPFIINSMKRAQRKYQPILIATPYGPEKVE